MTTTDKHPADYPNPGAHTPLRPAVPEQTPAAQGEAVAWQLKCRPGGAWRECSGDPASCPENEGYGCCKPNPADARDTKLFALYREFYDRVSDHFGDTHGVDSPQDGDPWWHETNAAYATRETVAAIETLDRSRLDTKIAADNAEHEAWKAKERADRAMGGES